MMKIVFTTNNRKHPFGGEIDNQALGGSFIAMICFARSLANYGHEVYSFQYCTQEEEVKKVKFIHRSHLEEFLRQNEVDVLIGGREIPIDRHFFKIKVMIYHGQQTEGAIRVRNLVKAINDKQIDHVFVVSNWHYQQWVGRIPQSKLHIVPNGFNLFPSKKKHRPLTLLWASNPGRGLAFLVKEIFPRIQRIEKNIKLWVAGSYSMYSFNSQEAKRKDKGAYGCLFRNDVYGSKLKKGIKYFGPLTQIQLADFFSQGTLLVYPLRNNSETGSIVTVQSLGYGTPAVVADRCVLPELVGKNERGIVLEFEQGKDYNPDTWAINILGLLRDKERIIEMRNNCYSWRKNYLWKTIGERINLLLKELIK